MEELVTRPLEQALSATAVSSRSTPPRSEGNSMLRLNFAWGLDLNEAMNDMRTRIGPRARTPAPRIRPADALQFDSNSQPIMSLGVEATTTTGDAARAAEHTLSPRLERVPGVASVTVNGGLRGRFTSSSRRKRFRRSISRSIAS